MKHEEVTYALRRAAPGRWLQLLGGLLGFAVAISLMIRSQLGLGPWDAFHVGLHEITGISIGGATIATGLVIIFGTLFMGIRPGPGTLTNMVLIGVFVDLILPWTPDAVGLLSGLAFYLPAIALCGLATGMYISAGLGRGPRDGLMIGLSQRTGWRVGRVRTLMEATVLGAGWAMGGSIGLGTVLFALLIGPATQWGLQLFGELPAPPLPREYAERSLRGAAGVRPRK